MGEEKFEEMLRGLLRKDFSAGTDTFRESLLTRCLEEVARSECRELDDSEIELLAAAGDPDANWGDDEC